MVYATNVQEIQPRCDLSSDHSHVTSPIFFTVVNLQTYSYPHSDKTNRVLYHQIAENNTNLIIKIEDSIALYNDILLKSVQAAALSVQHNYQVSFLLEIKNFQAKNAKLGINNNILIFRQQKHFQ